MKVLPGVRLNFSKRGTGVSFGGRGYRYSIGPSGRRTTISVPGTGLSYVRQEGRRQASGRAPANAARTQRGGCAIPLLGLLFLCCIGSLFSHPSTSPSPSGRVPPPTSPAAQVRQGATLANTRPTAVPATPVPPTATIPRGPTIGDTVTAPGWVLSLAKVSAAPADRDHYVLQVWPDARNTQQVAGTLADRFIWRLQNADGEILDAAPEADFRAVLKGQGRDSLTSRVAPNGLTHPLVFFPATYSAHPAALLVADRQHPESEIRFDLAAWVSPTPVPPTATPRPPTPVPFRSNGLGASEADWTRLHGTPSNPGNAASSFEAGAYLVFFSREADGWIADSVMRYLPIGGYTSLAQAQAKARDLIPADSRRLNSFTDATGNRIELYQSALLAGRFNPNAILDPWTGATPGTFTANYTISSGNVLIITIQIGDRDARGLGKGSTSGGSGARATATPARVPVPSNGGATVPQPSGGRIGAICKDGIRSSATGRGACSHHGGVAQWLYGP